MPLRLESIIKKKLVKRSERVKSVDFHPKEPWVLCGLYSGHLNIWNFNNETLVKTFEVVELPIRCAKFIARKQWIVCGSDDMVIRVFNYNTMEKVAKFEAHTDYIRYIEVHPSLPYFITTSDDLEINLWDWDRGFANTEKFNGHVHYVMMAKFNPKDPNYFASASLDKTVKVWCLSSPEPNFSLEGHKQGVNCLAYLPGGDRPFLISGSDDLTVKVWDYQTKACVHTLEGHEKNVSAIDFHPSLPLIITGSEDSTVRMWHSVTYRCETTLNYGMERVWSIGVMPGTNMVAFGYDEGSVVVKIGSDSPVISMDKSGKIMWCKNNDIVSASVKGIASGTGDEAVADGETVTPGRQKDLGRCELFPQTLEHNTKGNFVAVCGDGEYIIYTARQLRQKGFGSGLNFAWSAQGTGDYAVRLSSSRVSTHKNFKDHKQIKPNGIATNVWGGHMLAIGSGHCVWFYDWESCLLIRQIDVVPKKVYWADSGNLCAICCADSYYVLSVDRDAIDNAVDSGAIDEDGVDAFELLHEIHEDVSSGQWVGDCFVYTVKRKLHYYVGGQVMTLAHLERPMYILGYIESENRVFLSDKELNVVSYELLLAVLSYQTFVVRKEFDHANATLSSIPRSHHNKIAKFLEAQGFKDIALQVATDPELKFDLALELQQLDVAYGIMKKELSIASAVVSQTDVSHKWKKLGDLALQNSKLNLALECATEGGDLSGLLLLASCTGDAERLKVVATDAAKAGRTNVAFLAAFLLGDLDQCLQLLCDAGRVPEAAFLARTYLPSQVSRIVDLWRKDLAGVSARAAQSLADPTEYVNMFPQFELAQKAEALFRQRRSKGHPPAAAYPQSRGHMDKDMIEEVKAMGDDAIPAAEPEAEPEPEPEAEAEAPPAPAAEDEAPAQPAAAVAPPVAPAPEPAPAPAPAPKPAAHNAVDDDDDDAFLADLQDEIDMDAAPSGGAAAGGDVGDDDDLAEFDIDNY